VAAEPPVTRVLLVGLGTIARTHLAVLQLLPDVEVVGTVDPHVPAATYRSLAEVDVAADLVVVATPTPTHVPLVTEALAVTEGLVLCEKPLARTTAELSGLDPSRVRVAHHFAFSPEVEWARSYVAGLGPVHTARCVFNDAYTDLPEPQRASLVSSWVDSAPNQLSVVAAFAPGLTLRSHAARADRAATVLDHAHGTAHLTSNWRAAGTSKQTVLEYADRTVWLDHTSMTVVVTADGEVLEHVAYDGSAGRKEAHYLGLYRALLDSPDDWRLGVPLAADIARLLEAAAQAPEAPVTWSATSR
jgi:predicted dehydrogenase